MTLSEPVGLPAWDEIPHITAEEQAEERALLALYCETLLLRAQAAVLLKHRGYDVSDPQQFRPLQ